MTSIVNLQGKSASASGSLRPVATRHSVFCSRNDSKQSVFCS